MHENNENLLQSYDPLHERSFTTVPSMRRSKHHGKLPLLGIDAKVPVGSCFVVYEVTLCYVNCKFNARKKCLKCGIRSFYRKFQVEGALMFLIILFLSLSCYVRGILFGEGFVKTSYFVENLFYTFEKTGLERWNNYGVF